jgi:hypothetical protein
MGRWLRRAARRSGGRGPGRRGPGQRGPGGKRCRTAGCCSDEPGRRARRGSGTSGDGQYHTTDRQDDQCGQPPYTHAAPSLQAGGSSLAIGAVARCPSHPSAAAGASGGRPPIFHNTFQHSPITHDGCLKKPWCPKVERVSLIGSASCGRPYCIGSAPRPPARSAVPPPDLSYRVRLRLIRDLAKGVSCASPYCSPSAALYCW